MCGTGGLLWPGGSTSRCAPHTTPPLLCVSLLSLSLLIAFSASAQEAEPPVFFWEIQLEGNTCLQLRDDHGRAICTNPGVECYGLGGGPPPLSYCASDSATPGVFNISTDRDTSFPSGAGEPVDLWVFSATTGLLRDETEWLTIHMVDGQGPGFAPVATYLFADASYVSNQTSALLPGSTAPSPQSPDVRFTRTSSGATAERVGGPQPTYESLLGERYVTTYHTSFLTTAASNSQFGHVVARVAPGSVQTRASGLTLDMSPLVDPLIEPQWQTVWDDFPVTARFAAGRRLRIQGSFSPVQATLTAANPLAGWAGVVFEPGSGGTWSGDTVVEHVAGDAGPSCLGCGSAAAVTVESASPTFAGVTINKPVAGTYLHGLRVMEKDASLLATNLIVEDMTGSGVYAHGGATPLLQGEGVVLQRNAESAVYSTGTGTHVYLAPAALQNGELRGPQIINGDGVGVSATWSGLVTFSAPSGGLGFAKVEDNAIRGIHATGGADIYAGTTFSHNRNRILRNAASSSTGNGLASGAGTSVAARCNWWGTTVPANFRIGAQNGATFDAQTFLLGDPYSNPNVSCVDGGGNSEGLTAGTGGTAGSRSGTTARIRSSAAGEAGFSGEGDTPADRLSAAIDLPPAAAVAQLVALVRDEPDAPEAASALSLAGTLAARADAPTGALELLTQYAEDARPALRQAAHGALVGAYHARDDRAGALASAAALVAMGGEAARTGRASEVFLYAAGGQTDAAVASFAALEEVGPGSDEAIAARTHLAALGVALPEARTAALETRQGATNEASKTAAGAATLVVHPNPAASSPGASVALTLAEAAVARVTLHDLLGREVAVVLTGALAAGTHTAPLPAGLAPGVYALRATGDAGAILHTTRWTVVRYR